MTYRYTVYMFIFGIRFLTVILVYTIFKCFNILLSLYSNYLPAKLILLKFESFDFIHSVLIFFGQQGWNITN